LGNYIYMYIPLALKYRNINSFSLEMHNIVSMGGFCDNTGIMFGSPGFRAGFTETGVKIFEV